MRLELRRDHRREDHRHQDRRSVDHHQILRQRLHLDRLHLRVLGVRHHDRLDRHLRRRVLDDHLLVRPRRHGRRTVLASYLGLDAKRHPDVLSCPDVRRLDEADRHVLDVPGVHPVRLAVRLGRHLGEVQGEVRQSHLGEAYPARKRRGYCLDAGRRVVGEALALQA